MNLPVEWVSPRHLEDPGRAQLSTGAVPVIRVATLRAWLEHSGDGCITLEHLLAQLPED